MEDVLIYDIESKTFGKPDPQKDLLRFFGCYSYKTKKFYLITDREQVQKIINAHRFLVGFNNKEYDNPILLRSEIDLNYKVIIDLKEVFDKRANIIKIKEGILGDLLMEYSLKFIAKTLHIVTDDDNKKEIDYNIFNKPSWTNVEMKEIYDYTKRDIEVTKKMYEWVEEYFATFKGYMNEKDRGRKQYITASPASFGYKVICKEMGWEEKYSEEEGSGEVEYSGGYVAYPSDEFLEGALYCLDFNSLYPHVMMQCNIYGRRKAGELNDRPIWNGDSFFEIRGEYYSDEMSGVCKLFQRWYKERMQYKKNKDSREYTNKILLNLSYGLLGSSKFINTYDKTCASDVTSLARQFIMLARKRFKENGYKLCYTDTDSVYIQDQFHDKEKMLRVKDEIVKEIKSHTPFPQDTFDIGLDYEIKYMYFFKGQDEKAIDEFMDDDDWINKAKNLMKKNYIIVTVDDKVIIKNLGIKKKSNSPLSRKIFWDYIVPEAKKGKIKFSRVWFQKIIDKLLAEDFTLAGMRKKVYAYSAYEKTSPTGLSAQIALRYGAGIHFLIPNMKGLGCGKGKSYCTTEEFLNNKMTVKDINLDNVWKELEYFIKEISVKTVFDF